MGPNSDGIIQQEQLDNLCISLGLASSKAQVFELMGSRTKLNFQNFLQILKEAFAKNPKAYLNDKTLFFKNGQKSIDEKLPNIQDVSVGNSQTYFANNLRSNNFLNKISRRQVRKNKSYELRPSENDNADLSYITQIVQKKSPAPATNKYRSQRTSQLKEKETIGSVTFSNPPRESSEDLSKPLSTCISQENFTEYNFKNPRVYKNSKPMIKKFFSNFSQTGADDQSKMSIQMIVNNFRRKKIISTLKDGKIPYAEKNEVL